MLPVEITITDTDKDGNSSTYNAPEEIYALFEKEGRAGFGPGAPMKSTRVESLREARKQWAEAGHKLVPLLEYRRRYSLCRKCDYLVKGQCQLCTCFMRLKCLLAGMTCKDSRW